MPGARWADVLAEPSAAVVGTSADSTVAAGLTGATATAAGAGGGRWTAAIDDHDFIGNAPGIGVEADGARTPVANGGRPLVDTGVKLGRIGTGALIAAAEGTVGAPALDADAASAGAAPPELGAADLCAVASACSVAA